MGKAKTYPSSFAGYRITHANRWHAHNGTAGTGHVYQGRFKSFPVATDSHLLTVLRYVERNPLRAQLVGRAEDYPWSSLHRRIQGTPEQQQLLCDSPVPLGRAWVDHVNQPQTEAEVLAIRESLRRGRPFGNDVWQRKVGTQLGLEHTFRKRGRPARDVTS